MREISLSLSLSLCLSTRDRINQRKNSEPLPRWTARARGKVTGPAGEEEEGGRGRGSVTSAHP